MRSSACDTLTRLCARHVLCWPAFPLVCALGSTGSAADGSALFAGFTATTTKSDLPRPCIIGYGSLPSRYGPPAQQVTARLGKPPKFQHGALASFSAWRVGPRRCLSSRTISGGDFRGGTAEVSRLRRSIPVAEEQFD